MNEQNDENVYEPLQIPTVLRMQRMQSMTDRSTATFTDVSMTPACQGKIDFLNMLDIAMNYKKEIVEQNLRR